LATLLTSARSGGVDRPAHVRHVPWVALGLSNPLFAGNARQLTLPRPWKPFGICTGEVEPHEGSLPALLAGIAIDPILASRLDRQLGRIFDLQPDLQPQRVHAGRQRCRTKAQHIAVWHVVRYPDKTRAQILGVVKVKVLAAGELCDRFRGIGPQRIARGKKSHRGQPKRRRELADAVEHLLAVMAVVLGIGPLAAELGVDPDTVRRAVDTGRFRSDPCLRDRLTDPWPGSDQQAATDDPSYLVLHGQSRITCHAG